MSTAWEDNCIWRTQVTEDKLSQKNILLSPPYLETPKDIATKSGESRVWGSTIMQLFTTIGMSLGKK